MLVEVIASFFTLRVLYFKTMYHILLYDIKFRIQGRICQKDPPSVKDKSKSGTFLLNTLTYFTYLPLNNMVNWRNIH